MHNSHRRRRFFLKPFVLHSGRTLDEGSHRPKIISSWHRKRKNRQQISAALSPGHRKQQIPNIRAEQMCKQNKGRIVDASSRARSCSG